jgi:hypothetical protein
MESFIRKEIINLLPPSDKYNVPKLDDNNTIHHTPAMFKTLSTL